jgi:hypothetical protein
VRRSSEGRRYETEEVPEEEHSQYSRSWVPAAADREAGRSLRQRADIEVDAEAAGSHGSFLVPEHCSPAPAGARRRRRLSCCRNT